MTPFCDGNQVELLECGVAYFPALEAAIDRARHEIHVETYIFEDDETGRRIAAALCRAARRGVAVRVMVDGFGGRSFVERLQRVIEADGVSVLIYRPERRLFSIRRHRLRRLHRKIVIIDAREAFVGGINIIDDVPSRATAHPRHDYAVRVQGPLVGPVVARVRRLWWLVSWASLRQRQPPHTLPPVVTTAAGTVRAAFVIRDNIGHRRDIEDAYLAAIHAARHEIVIACAYFFPGRRFRQALVAAAARGVSVRLMLQGLSDHPMLAYATRALYPYLLSCGIRLFEYHRSYLHAKVAVVDDRWATVGSSNIDPFSLLLAREANIVVADASFAQTLHASLEIAMREGTVELRAESLRRLSRMRRLASWLAYQLVRFAIGLAGFRGKH